MGKTSKKLLDRARLALAKEDASWHSDWDTSDCIDLHLCGLKGYNDFTEEELRKELKSRTEGTDLEEHRSTACFKELVENIE